MALILGCRGQRQEEFLNLRAAWSIECVPGQPGLHRETLSWVCVVGELGLSVPDPKCRGVGGRRIVGVCWLTG